MEIYLGILALIGVFYVSKEIAMETIKFIMAIVKATKKKKESKKDESRNN